MKILIFAAHADDETLGAGGLIPKLIRAGHAVSVILASDGHIKARAAGIHNLSHFEKACELYGINAIAYLGLEDQYFDKYPIAEIANAAMKAADSPDLIISHTDTDLNKDHRIISDVAKIIGRPKKKPVSILGMEIANTTAWNGKVFVPHFYVDITDTIDIKKKAFSFYENEQNQFPYPYSLEGISVLAQYRGMEAGYQYAEAFQVMRFHAEHSALLAS